MSEMLKKLGVIGKKMACAIQFGLLGIIVKNIEDGSEDANDISQVL